ncbi:MAG: SMP-30/gluconolactonase/LRE family protein [Geminicoccaceae bacterium]|nr:SMP-30/gluconolactonase/LRE family protein [Geminicoccaceae bacterium]
MEIETVTDGLRFPEGPVALADGSVLVVEIAAGRLTRVSPDGTKHVVATPGGGPNGAAMGPDGKIYVCNNGGFEFADDGGGRIRPYRQAWDYSGGRIERVDLETGAVEVLYRGTHDVPLKGPNDIVFDGHGGFYFTDLGKVRSRELDRGAVFYARADGSLVREVIFPMITPNGIGLAPDDRTLYVAETEAARLWAFDILEPGVVSKEPFPSPHGGRLLAAPGGRYQRFDSLAVEADGRVCVATLVHGGITIVDPASGSIEHVPMPDLFTTNICFGSDELRTAWITLSHAGRLVACHWPRQGLALHHLNRG